MRGVACRWQPGRSCAPRLLLVQVLLVQVLANVVSCMPSLPPRGNDTALTFLTPLVRGRRSLPAERTHADPD